MAEPARRYDAPSSIVEETQSPLEVVRDALANPVESALSAEGGPWRSAAIGAALGFAIATVGITVIGTLAGIGAGGALGLAVFVGAFGGIGFGFMMGGVASLAHQFEAHPVRVIVDEQESSTHGG